MGAICPKAIDKYPKGHYNRHIQNDKEENKMVIAAVLAAIMGIGGAAIILTLYALHRITGGKMRLKKWLHINFDF